MKLSDYTVLNETNTNRHIIVYGTIDEYLEENQEDITKYTIVDPKDWTTNDMCEITSNLLEDINHHSACRTPGMIRDLMIKSNIDSEKIKDFFRLYMHEIYDKYGY